MKYNSLQDKIENFMKDAFLVEFSGEITYDSDLFKTGILDSYGYLKLIKYFEDEFDLSFSEEEILSNVLTTFSSIVDCISKKLRIEF